MRWGLQNGNALIPRASSESHLRSNMDALNWELSPEEFEALSSFKFQVAASPTVGRPNILELLDRHSLLDLSIEWPLPYGEWHATHDHKRKVHHHRWSPLSREGVKGLALRALCPQRLQWNNV